VIPTAWKKWLGISYPCKNPNSIFIGLVGGVGDLISAAPSVAALKRKYPEARITFGVGGGIFFNTIRNDPNIDHFETPFSYDVWKKRVRRKVWREKSRKHDLVLLLDNGNQDWWKQKKHLIDIYSEKCGVTLDQRRPVMYLDEHDTEVASKKLRELGVSSADRLLILSPETRSKKEMKEWPYNRFLDLIQKINENYDFKIVTFVSKDNPYDYNGTTLLKGFPLGPSAAMIRRANMFLGVDNGLTHIASCFDVKIVSIHIGYPVETCGPLSPLATTVAHEPFAPPESISVEEVYETFKNMI
jgi:ADP-heptose:LPS heptosyltransferase